MRIHLAAVIGMAALAMSPTSAFAHHNTTHSIVVQDAPCAPHCARPTAHALSLQFATGQRNPVTPVRERRPDAATPAAAEPCQGMGVITAVTASSVTIRHAPMASRRWRQ